MTTLPTPAAITAHASRPTAELAERIVTSEPARQAAAIAAARNGVLDFLACAFPGAADPGWAKLVKALTPAFGSPQAGAIGLATPVDIGHAALLNGYAGHALDFDDVHSSVRGHPGTVLLPALLALAQSRRSSADALLQAYVVGVETMAHLGRAIGARHYEAGFHNTATLGPLAVAAAGAFLLGFDVRQTENALGIAATQSAGMRLQFGSEVKPLHAGLAARSGLLAVQLAEAGLAGADDALGAPNLPIGFLDLYGLGAARRELVGAGWGEPWQIVEPGLYFKPYACCTATHYAADAALALRAEHAIDACQIVSVCVTFPPGGDTPLTVFDARNGLEARFSVEYVVAAALIDGALGLNLFEDRPAREDIRALARHVTRRDDADAPRASTDPRTRFSTVDVQLADGRQVSRRIDRLSSAADLAAKFADTTRDWPGLDGVPALVASMSSADDLTRLVRLFHPNNT